MSEQKQKTFLSELRFQLLLLEKAVNNKDIKQIQKLSNGVRRFRNTIKSHHLCKLFALFLPQLNVPFKDFPDFDQNFNEDLEVNKQLLVRLQKLIEVELYVQTLYLIYLVQNKHIKEAIEHGQKLVDLILVQNKRYLDTFQGIVYFFYTRANELANNLRGIREVILNGYRNACKIHDENGQALLINLILRNYLHYNEYELSYQFLKKVEFPEHASGNEQARYLYYTGVIHAIRGEYTEALSRLTSAIRKAPDNTAFGFKLQAHKVSSLVELLLGHIPNRDTFTQKELQQGLYPYYRIVSTVIKGDLKDFQDEVIKNENAYRRDKLFNLIRRLPQIVIKAGLRRINLSYSKISLQDVGEKLRLPVGSNPEQIVAKAIRDGTLNAVIDHENQILITNESNDLYGTTQPQEVFAKRINLCQNLYNQAVKALQFQNPQYEYAKKNNNDELTVEEELLNMVDIAGDF